MDFGKAISASKKPIIIAIGATLVFIILGLIPLLNIVTGMLGFLVGIAILGYAGFSAVKEKGCDIGDGAIAGGLTGLVSTLVGSVINFILAIVGLGVAVAGSENTGYAALGIGIVGTIIGIVIAIAFWTIAGIVAGVIGAFLAGTGKK